jgi:uncharacterized protein YlzI (FlbEa/FlbD family)
MINNVLSICWIFFISFSGCVKEKNTQMTKSYAFVLNVYTENGKNFIDADYVQYFIGDEAIEEAKKNGDADSRIVNGGKVYSVPGDFYILNKNNRIRKIEILSNVKLNLLSSKVSKNENSIENFRDFMNDYKDKLFLLTVKDDKVIEIEEIFTP